MATFDIRLNRLQDNNPQMNCARQDNPCILGYVLSACIGSALTLIAIELRRKSLLSSRHHCNLFKEDDTKIIEREEKNAPTTENGEPNYGSPPTRQRRRPPTQQPSFSGSFNEVDGDKRQATLPRINREQHLLRRRRHEVCRHGYERHGIIRTGLALGRQGGNASRGVRRAGGIDIKKSGGKSTVIASNEGRRRAGIASHAAPDEESCFEVASSLLVPLFRVICKYLSALPNADKICIHAPRTFLPRGTPPTQTSHAKGREHFIGDHASVRHPVHHRAPLVPRDNTSERHFKKYDAPAQVGVHRRGIPAYDP